MLGASKISVQQNYTLNQTITLLCEKKMLKRLRFPLIKNITEFNKFYYITNFVQWNIRKF
jgi:hypothetical protein